MQFINRSYILQFISNTAPIRLLLRFYHSAFGSLLQTKDLQRWLVISNFLILFVCKGYAQNPQLAGVSYVSYPKSGLKDTDKNSQITFHEFGGFVRVPYLFKNNKTIMINGISYAYVQSDISHTKVDLEGVNSEVFQVISYQTIIAQKLKNNLSFVFSLMPTIASDFEEAITSDDFIMQGSIMLSKKKKECFSYGLGVANTMRLGNIFLLPIVQLNYKNHQHSINALLPVKFDYIYTLDHKEKWMIGFRELANGGNINITASYNTSNVSEIDKVNYSRINMGPVVYYNINKFMQFQAIVGMSVRRKYNLQDAESRTEKIDLKNTPFFQVGIFLIPPKKL